MSLTPAGRTFLASVERALAEVERAADSVRADADPAAGKVAFGFLHTMGSETVPGLIRAFRADHPRIRFTLVQNYGEAMIERLRAGELDLCLTSPVPDAPDLVARRLDEQRLRLVVPDDHRLAARRRIRLAEAADETFVTLEPGYGLRRITDDLCAEAGFTPRVAFEGEEAETLRGLVAAGLGVALLPPPAVAAPGRGRTDGHRAAGGPRDRRRLAGRPPGHAPGGRVQAVPAVAPGSSAAGLAPMPGSYGPAAGRGFGAGVGHEYGDPVERVISHNPPFEDWISVGSTVCQVCPGVRYLLGDVHGSGGWWGIRAGPSG